MKRSSLHRSLPAVVASILSLAAAPGQGERPTVITMVPGEYMPGRRPVGVGERLTELRRAVEAYEKLHPHVRIVLQQAGGADVVEGEYIKTQIMGGIAPDIVAINTEAVWPDIEKGWCVALDEHFDRPNPYAAPGKPGSKQWWDSFANIALTRAKRAPNGKLYSLTFDLIETGIFYNKNLFRQIGVEPPATWAEFLDLQRRFKAAGYVPFAINITRAVDWAQDYLFDQMYYPILDEIDRVKGTDDEETYMRGYLFPRELCWNIMVGNISGANPRYREVWRLMREWREFWPRDISRTDVTRLFLIERSPMIWESSIFVRRMIHDDLVDFEWGVFYLPPITRESSPLGAGVDPAVIGGAGIQYSVTSLAETRGHLDQVLDFLAFLSTPERGGAIINEASMLIPNIAGVEMLEFLQPFAEIIRYRYGTTKWTYTLDNRFNDTNRRLIELFLGDALTLDQFLGQVDANNRVSARRMIDQQGWTFEGPEWQPR